jgi:hypothetical protein
MDLKESLEHEWPYLLSFLPTERQLEQTAKSWGAIQRIRAVDKASTLLRLALVYGFCGYSLRQTAAWAEAAEVASLSDVALLKRFRKASEWLGYLLGNKLAERSAVQVPHQARLRLIDATTICAPGSTGTDWRVHLGFDLGAWAISDIQLTQADQGESLDRYAFESGDLVVADRGYSNRSGLRHVIEAKAHFLVRLNSTTPLRGPGNTDFDLLSAVRSLPEAQAGSFDVEIQLSAREKTPPVQVRLVALRKSEAAAEEARKKLLRKANRNGTKVQLRTLELAGYILVLTSTRSDKLSPEEVLEIYRFRWQIELVFKRLKGLLHLDRLPAKDPELARTALFSKLLAALLLEELTHAYLSISPWGYCLRGEPTSFAVADPQCPAI